MAWLTVGLGLACCVLAGFWWIERKETTRLLKLARDARAEAEFCRKTVATLRGS